MGKSSSSPAPAPPDYAAANQAGVQADINTLPERNQINAAAQLGGVVADGKVYSAADYQKAVAAGQTFGSVSDFSGAGTADINHQSLMQQLQDAPAATQAYLDLQNQYGKQFAQSARDQLQVTDPVGFALRDQFGGQLANGSNSIESLVSGSGQKAPSYERMASNGPAQRLLGGGTASYGSNGVQTNQGGGNLAQILMGLSGSRQAAPASAAAAPGTPQVANEGTGNAIMGDGTTPQPSVEGPGSLPPPLDKNGNPMVEQQGVTSDQGVDMTGGRPGWMDLLQQGGQNGDISSLLQGLGLGGSNNGTDGVPTLQDDPQTAALRQSLQSQTQDQLDLTNGGNIDPALERAAQQAARARGASSGNLLGDGAGLQEALSVQLAQQQRADQNRANAQGLLSSGQSVAGANNAYAQQNFQNQAQTVAQNNDASNQAYQNAMNAINQRNQSTQNEFGAQQGLLQQQIGARQQDTANTQSFLGLTPIVSQGGQLSSLQQGAAPFMTGNGYQATGTAANAGQNGAQWAGQLYGAQSQQYAGQQSAAAAQNSGTMGAIGSIAGAAVMVF